MLRGTGRVFRQHDKMSFVFQRLFHKSRIHHLVSPISQDLWSEHSNNRLEAANICSTCYLFYIEILIPQSLHGY